MAIIGKGQEDLNDADDQPDAPAGREDVETETDPRDLLEQQYNQLDADKNGTLDLNEFVGASEGTAAKKLERDFAVLDSDDSKGMSFEELLNNPYQIPPDQRGTLRDGVQDLVSTQIKAIEIAFAAADENKDGQLDESEISAERFPPDSIRDFKFDEWDLNGDSRLTQQECRQALELAYGLMRPTRDPLRLASGRTPNLMLFNHLDGNADDRISADEFSSNWPETDRSASWLAAGDKNADDIVDFAEWSLVADVTSDPLAEFMRMDANFDAEVDQSELIGGTSDWQQQLAQYVFPGFDQDGSGALSLQEFQLLPQVNPVTVWHHPRQDADDDGFLSRGEFQWSDELFLSGLVATYFDLLDVNDDQRIGQDEFFFYTSRRDPLHELQHRDGDGDGRLSMAEFTSGAAGPERKRLERNFRLVDLDANGQLDAPEFANLPDVFPPDLRGSLPNPLAHLVSRQLAQVEEHWSELDEDENGRLDSDEFSKSLLSRTIPGLAMSSLTDWDRNSDQEVDIGEVRHMLEVSYGVRRPSGEALRLPSGRIANQMVFEHLDRDGNQQVTRREFRENWEEPERSQRWLREADQDKNNKVDFWEWVAVAEVTADPLAEFMRMDTDFDGRVDKTELLKGTPDWQQALAKYMFPGFDVDDDNGLSFEEFQFLPQVNPVAAWHFPRQDSNQDGVLSRSEFRWTEGRELAGLTGEMFNRLDVDSDGRLDPTEWSYSVRPTDVPHELQFTYLDLDQDDALSLREAMGNLDPEIQADVDPSWSLRLLRAEEAFRDADVNRNGQLDRSEYNRTAAAAIIAPDLSQHTGNLASVVADKFASDEESDWPWWGWMLLFDAILVVGVALFLMRNRRG